MPMKVTLPLQQTSSQQAARANASAASWHRLSSKVKIVTLTLFTVAILFLFLSPFAFMVFTSLKTQDQISIIGAPVWPARPASAEINGEEEELYTVPMNTCV